MSKELGEYIRLSRTEEKISLRKLEDLTGISFSHLSKIERGEYKPSREFVEIISNALDLDEDICMIKAGYAPKDLLLPKNENAQFVRERVVEFKTTKHTFLPVLGTIRAGEPIFMDKEYDEYEPIEKELLRGREGFVLRVQGDSMSGDRIYDGDKVVVVVQNFVEPNDIAVVAVNGHEATLKRVKCQDGMCMLIPSNPDMQPQIYPANEIHILGKVIESRRVHE